MPQKHVETLRALVEAINGGDFDDAVRHLHPDVELHTAVSGELDFRRLYRGRDGFQEWWEEVHMGFEVTVQIEETHEVAEGRVLQVEHWHTRGREGIEIALEVSDLYTFRDGLVSRVDGFRDRAEALEAAGLRE